MLVVVIQLELSMYSSSGCYWHLLHHLVLQQNLGWFITLVPLCPGLAGKWPLK